MKRVLVCGSRTWEDGDRMRFALESLAEWDREITIVHGAARGADSMAGTIARALGFDVEEYPADWRCNGRKAGPIRNRAMLATGPDRVLAFWDGESLGTAHCIREAHRLGIPVEEHIGWR